MRICMIGHVRNRPDEGARRVFAELADGVSRQHEVCRFDVTNLRNIRDARLFSPTILHAVIGPSSPISIPLVALWAQAARPVAVVLSAIQFTTSLCWSSRLMRIPTVVLVQSDECERKFRAGNWTTRFLPNGVNMRRFTPVSYNDKIRIREEMGFPTDLSILLHVGPVKFARNINILANLQDSHRLVVVVSRPSDPGDSDLISLLKKKGIVITTDFQESIQKFYQMSDGFVFPAEGPESCIDTPLSVLEACACNLPVISTRFGSLPRLLSGTKGVEFVETPSDIPDKVASSNQIGSPETRRAVAGLDWEIITHQLMDIYDGLAMHL